MAEAYVVATRDENTIALFASSQSAARSCSCISLLSVLTMRWTLRFALPALLIVITLFVILYIKFAQIWDQYDAPAYAWVSLQNTFRGSKLYSPPPVVGKVEDKVVVMAKVESEQTDWVAENLPEYALHFICRLVSFPSQPPSELMLTNTQP